ncbi:MAG: DUF4430 domain-containing protein [Candidatus Zixiibacteriota bacterium]
MTLGNFHQRRALVCWVAVGAVLLSAGCGQNGSRPRPGHGAQDSRALIIAYSPDSADTFACPGRDSIAVLDLLMQMARSDSTIVRTKTYPFGVLVDQIGYRRNGDGGFWLYSVNGAMIPESADKHRIGAGDTVRFLFDER